MSAALHMLRKSQQCTDKDRGWLGWHLGKRRPAVAVMMYGEHGSLDVEFSDCISLLRGG